METADIRYLKGLAKQYPTIPAAATEIVNLPVSYTHLTLPTICSV